MSNPNSKVTLRLSPKLKRSRVNEHLDVGSPTLTGFIRTFFILNILCIKLKISFKLYF